MTVSVAAVFEELGFASDCSGRRFTYNFGPMALDALQCMNMRFAEVFVVTGVWNDGRSIGHIHGELPLTMGSTEECVACLAQIVGPGFRPTQPTPWLEQGRAWREHLPWVRQRHAYDARPHCTVAREWFRQPAASLRHLAEAAAPEARATFRFDGRLLTIYAAGALLPMPAEGAAWPGALTVALATLRRLPKRLTSPTVSISAWEGCLIVDSLSIMLIEDDTG